MGKRERRIERLTGSEPRAVSSEELAVANYLDARAFEALREALRLQGRSRVRALVRELLEGDSTAPRALLVLDLYFDDDLLHAVLARIDAQGYAFPSELTAWCDRRVIPAFLESARRAERLAQPAAEPEPRRSAPSKRRARTEGDDRAHPEGPLFAWAEARSPRAAPAAQAPSPRRAAASWAELAKSYRSALLALFARDRKSGGEWLSGWDSELHFDAVRSTDPRALEQLDALLRSLPAASYERALRGNFARCEEEPWRLARALRPEVSDAALSVVARSLVAKAESVANYSLGPEARLCAGHPSLLDRFARAVRAALEGRPCRASLRDELERATGRSPFLPPATSIAPAAPLHPDGDLLALTQGLPGPYTRIYLLHRGSATLSRGDLSRVGGAPPGAAPYAEGEDGAEPMVHLLTLDLAKLPELAARFPRARALSLFLPDPWNAERHEGGTVVAYEPAQLREAPDDGARALETTPLDVPVGVFAPEAQGPLRDLQRALAGCGGYAGGGALMLHEGAGGVEPRFLFQFDESLCDLNLGDSGVLYVWWNDVQWQCL